MPQVGWNDENVQFCLVFSLFIFCRMYLRFVINNLQQNKDVTGFKPYSTRTGHSFFASLRAIIWLSS